MSPTLFDFNGAAVRVIQNESGIWFIASDVCRVLEISNPSDALGRIDEEDRTLVSNEGASNGLPVNAVNESGLYSLILGSRKPQAKAFKRWVTSEVLPQIRQTGAYAVPGLIPTNQIPQSFADALRLAADAEDARVALAKQLEEAQPKLETYDKIMSSDTLLTFRQVSELLPGLKMGGNLLVKRLLDERVLYRDAKKKIHAYRDHVEAGRFKGVESVYEDKNTSENKVSVHIKVTQTGLEWIAKRFGVEVVEMEPA